MTNTPQMKIKQNPRLNCSETLLFFQKLVKTQIKINQMLQRMTIFPKIVNYQIINVFIKLKEKELFSTYKKLPFDDVGLTSIDM